MQRATLRVAVDRQGRLKQTMSKNDISKPLPSGFVRVGGLVDESSVSLRLYGAALQPEEVTELLGIAPTTCFRRGFQRGPRSRPSPHGAWILEVRGEAPAGPEEHLGALLHVFPRSPELWASLTNRFTGNVSFGIHMSGWNRGFTLSPSVIAKVATLGLELDFDIYAYGGDDGVLQAVAADRPTAGC